MKLPLSYRKSFCFFIASIFSFCLTIMLITFKSKAAADVVMYKTHAQLLFELLEKSPERGIITADEVPHALDKLEARIAQSKREQSDQEKKAGAWPDEDNEDHQKPHEQPVSLAARTFPFLEMLRAAKREHQHIMWGV